MLKHMKFLICLLPLLSTVAFGLGFTNQNFATQAQIVGAGGTAADLLNDSKLYVGATGDTLANSLSAGSVFSGTVPNLYTQQVDPVSPPPVNKDYCYIKNDDKLYCMDATGTVTAVGGGPTTGTANTFAGFDSSGNLFTVPGYSIDTTGGTFATNVNQSVTPVDGTSLNEYSYSLGIVPGVSTTTANHIGHTTRVDYDNANAGFDFGGNIFAGQTQLNHAGNGSVNFEQVQDNGVTLGGNGSGHTGDARSQTNQVTVNQGFTADNIEVISNQVDVNQATVGNLMGLRQNFNLADSSVQNAHASDANLNVSGSTVVTQNLTGEEHQLNLSQTASNIGGTSFVGLWGVNIQDTAHIDNLNGNFVNVQVQDNATINNVAVSAQNLDCRNNANCGNIQGHNMNLQVRDNAQASGIVVDNPFLQTDNNASVGSVTIYNANPEFRGSTIIQNYQAILAGGNLRGTAHADNFTALSIGPIISELATATNFNAVTINPQVNNSAVVTNGITALSLSPSSTPTQPHVKGLDINLSNVPLSTAAIASGEVKVGLNINDGQINSFESNVIPGAANFYQGNIIGGNETVVSGDPTSSFAVGNNFAHLVNFQDDWGPDTSGLRLGFVTVGYVGEIQGAAGKTMDSWTGALAGASNVTGGGTVDQAIGFRSAGFLPSGGSISVNKMYGFQAMQTLCATAVDCWAYFDKTGNGENFFNRVAVGTSTFKVIPGYTYDFSGAGLVENTLDFQQPGGASTVRVQAPSTLATNYSFVLPPNPGTSSQVLSTDGAGNTSWANAGSLSHTSGFEPEQFVLNGGVTFADNFDGIRRAENSKTIQTAVACIKNSGFNGNTVVRTNYGPVLGSNFTITIPANGGSNCVSVSPAVLLNTNDLTSQDVIGVANGALEDLSIKLIF